jgi:hypothetical protein
MARQILPVFVTGADVDDLKRRLRAAVAGTDQSVQSCTTIQDAQRAAWGSFYASVLSYTNESSSLWSAAAQMNRGQGYEDELVSWSKQLRSSGCQNVVPDYDPSKDAARDATVNIAKWIGIGVASVAGAYVIGKALEVVILAEGLAAPEATERRR